ncbi:MAG: magnesium protoporphyrin IX methyltransferase [Sphingomonadaceae bacterium]|uniref:magnesium protoporphyrin IX methyltransferase n=1 Tax=Thermaurantiacus sp. TaxID=2820283 RepID=UPI00298F221F|nr:magnesium protoporphyrin IX methyltransferase [Thermaurantiacus sp.]MCS6987804.1 magnesium protoporphyrin IX methyltransferase [Sphingomonadaceae bacterium]MDW8414976.1 magnesium protoporphyrin IX methyltransferase [Thermaurantiacus sp.]
MASHPATLGPGTTYAAVRARLHDYFDRTAHEAWVKLTSDAPVGRIRATVRAGREAMRATLLNWLPTDLSGRRILDAGCGTGALAHELARRGARVVAVDLSARLVAIAHARTPPELGHRIQFAVGDMLGVAEGPFDHVVAMDSLIHYAPQDALAALKLLAQRTGRSILFTFAPHTPLLATLHALGRLFPRGHRAPMIVPVPVREVELALRTVPGWRPARDRRVARGFYTSHALEWVRTA